MCDETGLEGVSGQRKRTFEGLFFCMDHAMSLHFGRAEKRLATPRPWTNVGLGSRGSSHLQQMKKFLDTLNHLRLLRGLNSNIKCWHVV
jgi:hypothetical protein